MSIINNILDTITGKSLAKSLANIDEQVLIKKIEDGVDNGKYVPVDYELDDEFKIVIEIDDQKDSQ